MDGVRGEKAVREGKRSNTGERFGKGKSRKGKINLWLDRLMSDTLSWIL